MATGVRSGIYWISWTGQLYRHTTKMKQIMERLLDSYKDIMRAIINANCEKIKTGQENTKQVTTITDTK
jgi:hypothetical protein